MTTKKRDVSRPAEGLVGPLPCPFCGSDNLRVCDYGIECRNCGVWMGDGTQCRNIGKTVLDAWNHRANSVHHATSSLGAKPTSDNTEREG